MEYKVYTIFFKEQNAIYVGCTNNIKRRKEQHTENVKKDKSSLGKFIRKNNLTHDFELSIIAKFKNRDQALKYEKMKTIEYDLNNQLVVINDNYTQHCSRKGKNIANPSSSKKWVIINVLTHKIEKVLSLRHYAVSNNLSYKNMHSCAKHKCHIYKGKYKVFDIREWDNFSKNEQEKYISGKFLEEILDFNMKALIKRSSKKYKVIKPDGSSIIVTNLDKFARENDINPGNLHASCTTGKKANGFMAMRID